MEHLFTPDGERALATVMRRDPLLAFDFDGTLAPIVEQPEDAKISETVANRLSELARHRPLAIITGRSVADVMPRLGFDPHHVIGSHGAEDPHVDAKQELAEAMKIFRSRLSTKAKELLDTGIVVEDKQHSIALHYRRAPDHDSAMARISEFLQGLDPSLRTFGGKFVVNVVASNAPTKATRSAHWSPARARRLRCSSATTSTTRRCSRTPILTGLPCASASTRSRARCTTSTLTPRSRRCCARCCRC